MTRIWSRPFTRRSDPINCGQNCLASERTLVFDAVYDSFLSRVVEAAKGLRQGEPMGAATVDLGAIVSPLQLELIEALVADAVRQGARLLTGGKRAHAERGQYFEPTILADVTPEMRIAHEETFGPVMLLMRVKNEEDALRVANGTAYGLGATVCSRTQRAVGASARRSRWGTCRSTTSGSRTWRWTFPLVGFGAPVSGGSTVARDSVPAPTPRPFWRCFRCTCRPRSSPLATTPWPCRAKCCACSMSANLEGASMPSASLRASS